MNSMPLYEYDILLIHSSVDAHVDFFQFFTIINNGAMCICMYMPLCGHVFISLREIPRSGIAGSEK